MPIHGRRDQHGSYYQYGDHGAKYYYIDRASAADAYQKAVRQARAVHAHQNAQAPVHVRRH
jgi:hypothetical protein